MTKLCSDPDSRNFTTNFNFVPRSLFSLSVTLELIAVRIFLFNMHVQVFPYYSLGYFHHAALMQCYQRTKRGRNN